MLQNLECVYTQNSSMREAFEEWITNYIAQLGGWENFKALVSEVYCKSKLLSTKENKIPSETHKTSHFTTLEGRKSLFILNLENFLRTLPTTHFLTRVKKDDVKNLKVRYMCDSFLYLMALWFPGWFTFSSLIILGHLKVELISIDTQMPITFLLSFLVGNYGLV